MNAQRSLPLINTLPKVLDADDWTWHKPPKRDDGLGMDSNWWIGTDRENRKWLLKMRNGSYACREHVFATLAQRLGISCQSSAYVRISSETAEPRVHTWNSEPFQLGLWLMDEHGNESCSATCPVPSLRGKHLSFEDILRTRDSGIFHFDDLVRGDVLGHLCGQFEPHGHFITRHHEYVVIDNECMFASPSALNKCYWHTCDAARGLILEVCRSLVRIPEHELREIATIPAGYSVSYNLDLCGCLRDAQAVAAEYLEIFDDAIM